VSKIAGMEDQWDYSSYQGIISHQLFSDQKHLDDQYILALGYISGDLE